MLRLPCQGGAGEIVVCGIPFGTPLERAALQNVRNAGFTAVQIYTFWRDFEPGARGRFEWDKLDAKVRLIGPDSEEAWGHHSQVMAVPPEFSRLAAIARYHSEKGWMGLDPATEKLSAAQEGPGGGQGAAESTRCHAVSALFRRCHKGGGKAILYCGPVSFERDAQACFEDSGTMVALLDDVCAQSGAQPLGTREDEVARARVGGKLLILREEEK